MTEYIQQRGPRASTLARHQQAIEHLIATGTMDASARVGDWKSADHWRKWSRAYDLEQEIDRAKAEARGLLQKPEMGLREFRKKILGRETYPHQADWEVWMEDPEADHVLITTFPESSKTT